LFIGGADGRRPCDGIEWDYLRGLGDESLMLFHEYFHGETGRGLGANHQTGWSAMVAVLIGRYCSGIRKK
jgi:hypothetical protein